MARRPSIGYRQAMAPNVRAVEAEEFPAWVDQMYRTFFQPTAEGLAQHYVETIDRTRMLGAFEGAAVVATLRSDLQELTVPGGGVLAASGLTNVTVAPSHRRRGLLTEMATRELDAAKDRGEACSTLIAAEYPIYGRFGYGPATTSVRYEVATGGLRFTRPSTGRLELVDPVRFLEVAPGIYDQFRRAQPGSIDRNEVWWEVVTGQRSIAGRPQVQGTQAVFYGAAGELAGYVRYEGKPQTSDLRHHGTVVVHELVALGAEAYRALWGFVAELDLAVMVEAPMRPTDELLPLLLHDARKVTVAGSHDHLWLRPLDVEAMLEARRYQVAGQLVIEVHDPSGYADGRFELDGSPEGASCKRTPRSAELEASVGALGAAYLGGHRWTDLEHAGWVRELVPGAAARADLLFGTLRAPWCSTWF